MKLPGQANRRPASIFIHSLALTFDQGAQALQIFSLRMLTSQPHQRVLGQSPGVQCLTCLLGVRRSNTRPMVGPQHDDLFVGQLGQHPTHIGAADPEHLLETFFGEAAGGIQALFEDCVEQARIQVVHRRVQAGEGQGRRGRARVRRRGKTVHGRSPV